MDRINRIKNFKTLNFYKRLQLQTTLHSEENFFKKYNNIFRETGNKTKRYSRGGKFISRDPEVHGPALDKDGKYVSQKPKVSYRG